MICFWWYQSCWLKWVHRRLAKWWNDSEIQSQMCKIHKVLCSSYFFKPSLILWTATQAIVKKWRLRCVWNQVQQVFSDRWRVAGSLRYTLGICRGWQRCIWTCRNTTERIAWARRIHGEGLTCDSRWYVMLSNNKAACRTSSDDFLVSRDAMVGLRKSFEKLHSFVGQFASSMLQKGILYPSKVEEWKRVYWVSSKYLWHMHRIQVNPCT